MAADLVIMKLKFPTSNTQSSLSELALLVIYTFNMLLLVDPHRKEAGQ